MDIVYIMKIMLAQVANLRNEAEGLLTPKNERSRAYAV